MLDINDIMKILPHRYPFLLVDRILEFEAGKRAVGIKNVTINEPFFQGHFPGMSVMPGVLIAEAMAQVAGVTMLVLPESEGKLAYYAGIDDLRMRRPVIPGDQLRIEIEVIKMRGFTVKIKGKATVDGAIACEGVMLFSLVDQDPSGKRIHKTAVIHPLAKIGKNVSIGAYAVIGPEVEIGEGTSIGDHATLVKWVRVGSNNQIHYGATIGTPPQDTHYQGERSWVVIGDRNILREYVTIHRATGANNVTQIGSDNFFMANAHIAHNCSIGNQCIFGNFLGLTGHITVDDQVVISGLTGIHQFVRVGRLAMIGGMSKITQDVPPFMMFDGNPAQARGINSVGMHRRQIASEVAAEIKKAYRILYLSKLNTSQAIDEIRKKCKPYDAVKYLLSFLEVDSRRGVIKKIDPDLELEEEQELIFKEIPELGI